MDERVLNTCVICSKDGSEEGINLLCSTWIHRSCYTSLVASKSSKQDGLLESQVLIRELRGLIRPLERPGWLGKIKRFLFDASEEIAELKSRLANAENNLKQKTADCSEMKDKIELIHSRWIGCPPDWEQRTIAVKQRSCNRCERCRWCVRNKAVKHLRYIKSISEGGDHSLDNLVYICVECEAMPVKIALLEHAIDKAIRVEFNYVSNKGETTERIILPKYFETPRYSQCVIGDCELRQEERTFAIGKMNNLRVV